MIETPYALSKFVKSVDAADLKERIKKSKNFDKTENFS